ncbi:MAG: hypothetical protein UX39_C0008G0033 [Candidatus Magasanikbacteria bacterium GW2011_GWA2_46_17]|uniref:Uncharacterized protein n=1 Tax=Candidatus Magasanikbacteria bacterium GW2011_GWA2_46_17 TaxID=1619042 RepID=A0A0G1S019_9BACT|nr:MAG: hypothetical protein UX39_C0008G0033 [Candidatus Magasanikbacteria bacterium GW2011_GWA2_46_17]
MKYLALTLFASMLFMATTASAQNLESLGGQSGVLLVRTVPARPTPHQFVTVIIESFSIDLDRSNISWFLNNNLSKDASNQKTFSFKTGGPGSTSNILIVVKTFEGEVIQETLNIRPATVDVLWEAESYVPPFYKGKSLYPFQGTVKIVALPNIVTAGGGTLSAKNLVYNWKVDGHPATAASGYGKNFIFFRGDIPLKAANITVEVSSVDQSYVAEGNTVITPVQPGIVFYEDSPLLGVLQNRALFGNITLRDEEIKIVAIPYFVGVTEREGRGLSYNWRLNEQKITGSLDKSALSFRQEKESAGNARVSLEVSSPSRIFQTVTSEISLLFGNPAGVSIF